MFKEKIHAREQKAVLDCFLQEDNLTPQRVVTILRAQQENEIFTSLPYKVRYILNYLEMNGDITFNEEMGTYNKIVVN